MSVDYVLCNINNNIINWDQVQPMFLLSKPRQADYLKSMATGMAWPLVLLSSVLLHTNQYLH